MFGEYSCMNPSGNGGSDVPIRLQAAADGRGGETGGSGKNGAGGGSDSLAEAGEKLRRAFGAAGIPLWSIC